MPLLPMKSDVWLLFVKMHHLVYSRTRRSQYLDRLQREMDAPTEKAQSF